MYNALTQTVSESLITLRLLIGTQFVKPIRELEREKTELPPGYVHVMDIMKSQGNGPFSMTDLASKICVSKPNLTIMVDRLCAEGFVERLADATDRRIVNVALTREGMEFLDRHKALVMDFIRSRLSLLEEAELKKLKEAMDDIAAVVNTIGERNMRK